jgi:hypothetical protein
LAVAATIASILCAAPLAIAQEQDEEQQESGFAEEAEEARVLLHEIEQARERIAELGTRIETADGERARLLERRLVRERWAGFEKMQSLARNLVQQEEQGLDVSALRAVVDPMMQGVEAAVAQIVLLRETTIQRLSDKRDAASPSERPIVERRLDYEHMQLDVMYEAYLTHIGSMEILGLDAHSERADLADRLIERAENLAVRVELAGEQQSDLDARLADLPGDADLLANIQAVQEKLGGSIRSLNVTSDLMDELKLDTARYRELLLAATGHLTTDVLDTGVVMSLLRNWMAAQETRDGTAG